MLLKLKKKVTVLGNRKVNGGSRKRNDTLPNLSIGATVSNLNKIPS